MTTTCYSGSHYHEGQSWAPEKSASCQILENLAMRSTGRLAWGLRCLMGRRAGNLVGILTYHRVAPHVRGLSAPLHNVSPQRFGEQLAGLQRQGFRFWSLNRLLTYRAEGRSVPPRTVVVTFDDGFATTHRYAWPILQALHIPATVFVSTAFLDSDCPFPFDAWGVSLHGQAPLESYRPLTFAECLEMSNDGLIEFGAHTHTHQDFRDRPAAFREDLARSVDIVLERLRPRTVPFAFPYGSPQHGYANAALMSAAISTRVTCGLTTQCVLVDPRRSPFGWGRINAFSWDTSATLGAKLDGWYSWAPSLRQALGRAFKPTQKRSRMHEDTPLHEGATFDWEAAPREELQAVAPTTSPPDDRGRTQPS